jgi:benzylsuccinate CoA-transferase BbsF subunit
MEQQALAGIKVVDFGWAIAGSLVGKYLGDYGAQVIRVESSLRPDLGRSDQTVSTTSTSNPNDNPMFTHLNTSKYSMAFNLKHPRAREVVDRLISWGDVINANFTPGTLTKLGFGYEYIRSIKPQIIMAEGSAYGQTGPLAHQWGLDGTGAALSGYLYLTGWPDRGPVAPNVPYGDTLLPCFTAIAIVAALDYKQRTGKGQYIDAGMIDVCIHQITPALLDWEANRHLQTRNGNRISYAAPHGVFPCQGDDQWCAIAVFTDNEWEAFCRVIGDPSWTKDLRFATVNSRKENEDALEELVAKWTEQRSAEEVMQIMQAAGVPAGMVETVEDLVKHDPQLKERQFMLPLKHPVMGVFNHPNPPFRLQGTAAQVRTSPCLGEHTEYVCTEFLGMSNDEFVELYRQGVFR